VRYEIIEIRNKLYEMRIKLVMLLLLVVVGAVSYSVGKSRSRPMSVPEDVEVESVSDEQQKLPSCDVGRCPDYVSADIDGDSLAESIVYQPWGMTKGAGSVWVIKNDEVVFRSDVGAMFDYKVNEEPDGQYNGLVVVFVDEFDQSGVWPKSWREEKWIYENGKYVLGETKTYNVKPW